MINWEEIRKEFEEADTEMKLLAEKNDIKATTIRSRKNVRIGRSETVLKTLQYKNVAMKKVVERIQGDTDLTEKQKLFCLYF